MKTLGNIFLVVGTLCCISLILIFWGVPLIAVGALLRIAAANSSKAHEPGEGTPAASAEPDSGRIFGRLS